MNKFLTNIKEGFGADEDLDRGDIVQTVLLIAGFAIVVIVVVSWIGTAIMNKGADVAVCIEGANTFKPGDEAYESCLKANHANKNGASVKEDTTYKNRFN